MSGSDLIHRIVQNFREVGASVGKSPGEAEYFASPLHKFTRDQIISVFKSWPALIRAAGLITPAPKKFLDPVEEPKILVIDLEVFPMEVFTYGLWDQNIGVNQIIRHASLASFAAQYLGKDEVIYHEVNWKKNPRDDKALTRKLHELMNEADIICGQNSDAFDVKVANERFLHHDLGPSRPVKYMDTKKQGKRHFHLPSYSLAYMSERFCKTKKLPQRVFAGFSLQIECLKKNPEAWREMREYNELDVRATAELIGKFAPWASPNLNAMRPGRTFRCTNVLCGSSNVIHRGWVTRASGRFKQYSCKDCNHWFNESGAINNYLSPAKKASLKGPS